MGLFSEIKIKDLKLKNKIVLAPMCMNQAKDGFANMFHTVHYATRAMGQMALLIVEATAVSPEGRITNKDLGLWSDEHIKPLKQIVDAVKQSGGKIGIQLAHAGRKAKDSLIKLAPSKLSYADYPLPKAMNIDEIHQVKQDFIAAAKRAEKAGFDFIEIHAAHGYLLHQFLSPISNTRTDYYGGLRENRNKLLIEIIQGIKNNISNSIILGLRLSLTDFVKGGLNPEDYLKLLAEIPENLIDVINVTTGGLVLTKVDEYSGYQLKYARLLKEKTPYIIMAGGLIDSAGLSNSIIANNEADLIYYGRLALREPYFPLRFAQELKEEIIWPSSYIRGKNY